MGDICMGVCVTCLFVGYVCPSSLGVVSGGLRWFAAVLLAVVVFGLVQGEVGVACSVICPCGLEVVGAIYIWGGVVSICCMLVSSPSLLSAPETIAKPATDHTNVASSVSCVLVGGIVVWGSGHVLMSRLSSLLKAPEGIAKPASGHTNVVSSVSGLVVVGVVVIEIVVVWVAIELVVVVGVVVVAWVVVTVGGGDMGIIGSGGRGAIGVGRLLHLVTVFAEGVVVVVGAVGVVDGVVVAIGAMIFVEIVFD